jgi:dethiobiotin synthetase
MHGLFFTGTDTGVGKTWITAAVTRLLRRQGHPVQVCKPVASGARWVEGRWLSEDTELLAEAAGMAGAWDAITYWTFPDPLAPSVAARRQGVNLTRVQVAEAVRRHSRPGVPLLVEGVGGLLCPLTGDATVADLAADLRFPVVVVARRSLGTLNHTLLTLEVARGRGLAVAGVVVNETTPPEGLAEQTNVEELRRWLQVPLLAVISYHPGQPPEEIPTLAAVDWRRLCSPEPNTLLS